MCGIDKRKRIDIINIRCPEEVVMKKVAIVGVEGSGKTVMLAGLGDLYTYPDEEGYFLSPKNFSTAAYVAEKIARMRNGEWPAATAGDEMQGLDWTLRRREPSSRGRPENICEVSFLDFAGEVYRTAFGIGAGDPSLAEQAERLKRYVREADELIVLINLRDVIVHGIRDMRVQEAMWITNAILDAALTEEAGRKVPRTAIVLSQADSYFDTIEACGGAAGVLQKYLPHVANNYGWLDVFAASAVDKTNLNDNGNAVPAEDFTSKGLLPIMTWIREGDESPLKASAANHEKLLAWQKLIGVLRARRDGAITGGTRMLRPNDQSGSVSGGAKAVKRVQLWEGGPYWADRNIGADQSWNSGYYFRWGDTIGYKRENDACVASDGSSPNFVFSDANMPTYNKSIAELNNEGYITASEVLTPEHDVAQVQWGGGWRMPTKQELEDLCNKCDWSWTTRNGVNGYVVCGRDGYASASIFLPAFGYGNGTSLYYYAGSSGHYWSSVPHSDGSRSWSLYFDSSGHYASNGSRYCRFSIRPVQGFTK